MGKQEIEEEKMNMDANKRPTQNGVIISVYVESPKMRSPKKTVALKKTHKPISSVSKTPRKCVSDRRAHLLAYARELRNAGSQEIHRPRNNLRTKPKVSSSNYTIHSNNI